MLRSISIYKNVSILVFLVSAAFVGCADSGMIQITVTNAGTEKLSMIVVSYPEATFGINSLEPGKSFHYKIKPTATGPLNIDFFNSRSVEHKSAGPTLHPGDKGTIEIKLTEDGATSAARIR